MSKSSDSRKLNQGQRNGVERYSTDSGVDKLAADLEKSAARATKRAMLIAAGIPYRKGGVFVEPTAEEIARAEETLATLRRNAGISRGGEPVSAAPVKRARKVKAPAPTASVELNSADEALYQRLKAGAVATGLIDA